MAENPIQNYIKNRVKGNVNVNIKKDVQSNPIQGFIRNKISSSTVDATKPNTRATTTTEIKKEDVKKTEDVKSTLWQKISKQLMKPVGVVAAETENLAQLLTPGGEAGVTPGKRAVNVLLGKEEESFSNVLRDNSENIGISKGVAGALGFSLDLIADPLNFIGIGGLTKVGKLASKVASLKKAGKAIEAGSKLAKDIAKTGYTVDELVLAASKAEQAAAGQRSLLRFGGKTLIKGEGVYDKFGGIAKTISETKPAQILKNTFSTKTGNTQLDDLMDKYKNLSSSRRDQVIKTATTIQKKISNMAPEKFKMVAEAIENPVIKERITDGGVKEVVGNLEELFSNMKIKEKDLGVLKTELENYFPRIKTKDSFGDRIKFFFSHKKYNATLNAAKERKIMKLADESGSEVIGNYKKLGLRKINFGVVRDAVEKEVSQKTEKLQKALDVLLSDKIDLYTGDLQDLIGTLKQNVSRTPKLIGSVSDLVEPTAKELDDIVNSIVWPKRDEMNLLIGDLEELVKTSQGKEFLKPPLGFSNSKNARIKWLSDEMLKTQNSIADKLSKIESFDFIDGKGKLYKQLPTTVEEINKYFGKEFFEANPAVAYATRGLSSVKAVTAKEFLDDVAEKFFVNAEDAPVNFIESSNPILKGLKAEPEIVNAIDKYITGIQPSEMKSLTQAFDKVQNIWKAQALLGGSYHTRNMISNFWNSFLAGVKSPQSYMDAMSVQLNKNMDEVLLLTDAGETLTKNQVKKLATDNGVIGGGLYGADIAQTIKDEVSMGNFNPLSQKFILYKKNRAIGETIENNARLAHFIDRLKKGYSASDAAKSVKKYLFDYDDLTDIEKKYFKRLAPFYTWSRKNLPVQIENLIVQPEKFAFIAKTINEIESNIAPPATEKYMSDYIKDNIPVRIRQNEDGNTEYFLMGSWLPSAQAIDFLSQPLDNIVNMVTPLAKTPVELWANKSFFFENTLGESSKIEYYEKQPTEFIGIPMRKKTAHLLRNIRVLNDFNKIIKKGDAEDPDNSAVLKLMDVLFGHAVTYDVGKSREYYRRDTDEKIRQLESAIKRARKMKEASYAEKLIKDLKKFKKERGG